MIKVCMLVPDFDRIGGYERQAFFLSRALSQKECKVSILTTQMEKSHKKEEIREGIIIYRYLPEPNKSLGYRCLILISIFLFFIRKGKDFDIIHAHSLTHAGILCVIIGKIFGKKTLVKIATEGDLPKILHSLKWTYRIIIKFLRFADRCISLSSNIKQELLEAGISEKNIFSVTNGVDTELFMPLDVKYRDDKKKELSLAYKKIVIFVGRFEKRKGADVLIGAWKRVSALYSNALLVLIGFGPEKEALEALTKEYNIENHVLFAGKSEGVVDYLNAGDLFVIPSRREGNPNTLLEALACGLPVIASSIGGIVEVIEDKKNGILIAPDDEQLLAEKILYLLKSEKDAAIFGKNARESALSLFSLDKISDKYKEEYKKLLLRTSKPR